MGEVERQGLVDEIADDLECERLRPLDGDIWFWDSANGAVCDHGEEAFTEVWVYEHEQSPAQVLLDSPVGPGQEALVDDHLLVTGPPSVISGLDRDGRLVATETELPATQDLDEAQQWLTFCTRSVGSFIGVAAEGETEDPETVRSLDALMPGFADHVDRLDDTKLSALRAIADSDFALYRSRMSEFASDAAVMCRRSFKASQSTAD